MRTCSTTAGVLRAATASGWDEAAEAVLPLDAARAEAKAVAKGDVPVTGSGVMDACRAAAIAAAASALGAAINTSNCGGSWEMLRRWYCSD